MQKQSQTVHSFRKFLTPKLSSHKNIRPLFSFAFKIFYSITGSSHVLPDFYILGGQKCGTTSMFMYLTKHPAILSPDAKDIRFFDKYFFKGINWYRINFPSKSRKSLLEKKFKLVLTGEGTERYLDHPHAPERIKQVTPNAKFIILLRNPIDRAFSHYAMNVDRNMEYLSFEDAIKDEDKRISNKLEKMENDETYYDDIYFRNAYIDRSIYVTKLKRWFEIFPKEQFLIIQSEKFWSNLPETYSSTLKFLDLPPFQLDEFKQFKKRNYKNLKIENSTRKELIDLFRPYNEQLFELLGEKFDWDD